MELRLIGKPSLSGALAALAFLGCEPNREQAEREYQACWAVQIVRGFETSATVESALERAMLEERRCLARYVERIGSYTEVDEERLRQLRAKTLADVVATLSDVGKQPQR